MAGCREGQLWGEQVNGFNTVPLSSLLLDPFLPPSPLLSSSSSRRIICHITTFNLRTDRLFDVTKSATATLSLLLCPVVYRNLPTYKFSILEPSTAFNSKWTIPGLTHLHLRYQKASTVSATSISTTMKMPTPLVTTLSPNHLQRMDQRRCKKSKQKRRQK